MTTYYAEYGDTDTLMGFITDENPDPSAVILPDTSDPDFLALMSQVAKGTSTINWPNGRKIDFYGVRTDQLGQPCNYRNYQTETWIQPDPQNADYITMLKAAAAGTAMLLPLNIHYYKRIDWKTIEDDDGMQVPIDFASDHFQWFLDGVELGRCILTNPGSFVFRQVSPTVMVAPTGENIPMDSRNSDYRAFRAALDVEYVQIELDYDPMEVRP